MSARQIRAVLAAVVLGAGVLAGCGGSDDDATTAATSVAPATQTGPVASTPDATQPPPAATEPLPPETTATQPSTATEPGTVESPPPGRAEEEPVRVPATFVADDGGLTPPRITVPPFLAVEVSVSSGDGKAHTVVVGTPRAPRFDVAAGGRGAVRLPGQRAGEYAIELDGREAGTLVVGGEVGP